MKWVSMAEQPHTSLRSLCAMPSVGCTTIGLWSSGNTLSGVMNYALPSGSLMDESGFADARRMLPAPKNSANCKVWWKRNNGLRLFFMVLG